MRKIKAENVIVGVSESILGNKIEKSLVDVINEIKVAIKNKNVFSENVRVPKNIVSHPLYLRYGISDKEDCSTLDEELDNINNEIETLKSLKKSIDLILQELKLKPDEWEYKTETKLVKKSSMTANKAVKAGK